MIEMASQITCVSIVCLTACSDAIQRKHQSSASLAFVRGIHRWPVNSSLKEPVRPKLFPFDDVIVSFRNEFQHANGYASSVMMQGHWSHCKCLRHYVYRPIIIDTQLLNLFPSANQDILDYINHGLTIPGQGMIYRNPGCVYYISRISWGTGAQRWTIDGYMLFL